MKIDILNLIWHRIVDIQTAERATRQGLYRSVLGICEFIALIHITDSRSIEAIPINLSLIWVIIGALIFYKLRLGAFLLFGVEFVISYSKYKFITTATSSFFSVLILTSLIVCITLSINAIRGIVKYNKFKAEQAEVTTGKHFSKADLMARIIEFVFFAFFAILAHLLSKP